MATPFQDGFRDACFRRGVDPAVAAALEKTAEGRYHTVQDGEILGRIARRYGVTPQAVADANGFKTVNDIIRPKQRLVIPMAPAPAPAPATPAPAPAAPAATAAPAGEREHVIQSGDILGRLAHRYGTTAQAIADLNGFNTVNDTLKIGRKLRIPAAAPAPAPAAPAAQAPVAAPKKYHGLTANNPGNLRVGPVKWQGRKDIPGAQFWTFDTPFNGIRAAARNAYNYRARHGIDTLTGLARRWAPKNENDTNGYIARLSQQTGWAPTQSIDFRDEANLRKLLPAIFTNEVGATGYDPTLISNAVHDAVATIRRR